MSPVSALSRSAGTDEEIGRAEGQCRGEPNIVEGEGSHRLIAASMRWAAGTCGSSRASRALHSSHKAEMGAASRRSPKGRTSLPA